MHGTEVTNLVSKIKLGIGRTYCSWGTEGLHTSEPLGGPHAAGDLDLPTPTLTQGSCSVSMALQDPGESQTSKPGYQITKEQSVLGMTEKSVADHLVVGQAEKPQLRQGKREL